jgi:hypothetical protein
VLVPTQESTTDMSFFKFHCVLTGGPPGRRYENDTGWHGEIKDGLLYVHWFNFRTQADDEEPGAGAPSTEQR